MSKTKFILEKGNVDSDNQQVIVDGIIFKDEYPIYKDFENCIGSCRISVENGMLTAEAELSTEHEGLYPSIGFLTIQSYEKNDVTVHTKSKLICIGLCENPNLDPTIKPIKST